MGTCTLPPQRTESFRHILRLPPLSILHNRSKLPSLRARFGASAAPSQILGSGVHRHARASPPAQRTATGHIGRSAEVLEARRIATPNWQCRSFLAKAILRFQHSRLAAVCREAPLRSRQSREGRVMRAFGRWEWSSFRHQAAGFEGRAPIELEWRARRRERAAGQLCPAAEPVPSSQKQACVGHSRTFGIRFNSGLGLLPRL